MHRKAVACAGVAAAVVAVSGCGSNDKEESKAATPAKAKAGVIDVASMNKPPAGAVTYCTGKDASGAYRAALRGFDAKFAAQGYKLKFVEFPESADEQRAQIVQRQRAKSPECDIYGADVVWTAEFANQGWLYDMTPYIQRRASEFVPSTFESTKYEDRNWAVPFGTNAGLFYYRTDQVTTAPSSWQQVYEQARDTKGLVYQGAPYEGLTVNFLEVAFAAGGSVLSPDGKTATIDSPENLAALSLMADGVKDGAATRAVTTYMEEPTRRAFEADRATFARNWSYAWVLGQDAPKIKGKFKAVPLPSFDGGGRAGVLGGNNLVVSRFSKNPGLALKAIDYITSAAGQTRAAVVGGQPPTLKAVYEEPSVKKSLPLSDQLAEAVANAKSRPVSPVYTQISEAIYKNVNKALAGREAPERALKDANDAITKALASF